MVIKKATPTEKVIKEGNKLLIKLEQIKVAKNLLEQVIKDDLRTNSWLSDVRLCVGTLKITIKKMEKENARKTNKKTN